MSYFTKDCIKFLRELKKNNNREWFNENKKRYEQSVKEPFHNFIQEMISRIHSDDPDIILNPKDAIFRIYRDVRFSNDKSPYKTQVGAVISPVGRKDYKVPGTYIEINTNDFRIYGGLYGLDKNQLQAVREHIAGNLKKFSRLIRAKKFIDMFGEVRGELNKRVPAEFNEVLTKQPLIANKQFYYFGKLDVKTILDPKLPDIAMEYYFAAKPLNQFLREALN